MTSLSDGCATLYTLPDQTEADFSDSDYAVGNDESTTTAAAPPQDLPKCPASPCNHNNLNSSDKEAIDAIHDNDDDLSTSEKKAMILLAIISEE